MTQIYHTKPVDLLYVRNNVDQFFLEKNTKSPKENSAKITDKKKYN